MAVDEAGRWAPVWDTAPDREVPGSGSLVPGCEPRTTNQRPETSDDPARYPHPQGTRYILPCHLLHYGGLYEYLLIDVAQARLWLLAGPATSYLTHPFLHAAFEGLIGFLTPPGVKKPLPALGYHDDALCFIVEGYETLPDLKRGDSRTVRQLVEEERYTFGLLRRLS